MTCTSLLLYLSSVTAVVSWDNMDTMRATLLGCVGARLAAQLAATGRSNCGRSHMSSTRTDVAHANGTFTVC